MQTIIWNHNPNQNAGVAKPLVPSAKLGNTSPGPVLLGAVRRARMVAMEPRTWAAISVKVMWNLVMVCRRIIPNPTPCRASSTPSHNHRHLPKRADVSAEPAQGRYCPTADVPHSIWHHLGAPRPIAKTGRIHECDFESLDRKMRIAVQMTMKKAMTSKAMAHPGAC